MLKSWFVRLRQGRRTLPYPDGPVALPGRFRGLPVLTPGACRSGCAECVAACPTGALERRPEGLRLDLGRCLFCGECEAACPDGAVRFTRDHRLAGRDRQDLVLGERARGWRHSSTPGPGVFSGGRSSCARSAPPAATAARSRSTC